MNSGISFVILTWNSRCYIENCLNSIVNINSIEKEIIIIDNGSTDGTVELIKNNYPQVYTIELDKNYGTTYTRNLGLKKRNPDNKYICILDSDTEISEGALLNMIKCLEYDSKYMLAVPQMYDLDKQYQASYKKFPTATIKFLKGLPINKLNRVGEKLERYNFRFDEEVYEVDYGISACWVMKRDVLDKIGLLDEKMFYAPEDVDYCARIWKCGGKVILATGSIIVHATQRLSKRKFFSKLNLISLLDLVYYFWKHGYIFSAAKIRHK